MFNKIVNLVAQSYGVKPEDILGHRRTKDIADARQVVCFLSRDKGKKSFPEIARSLGKYDHTTVLYSYRKILEKIGRDENFKNYINKLSGALDQDVSFVSEINAPKPEKIKNIEKIPEKEEDGTASGRLQRMFRKEPINLVRQTGILEKYKNGFTLQEVGEIYNLTRERIRQIVMKALSYEAFKIFNEGGELDLSVFIGRNLEEHLIKLKERRGIQEKLPVPTEVTGKEIKWSRYHDRCRMCGTTSVKHISYGYCEWCYAKSDDFKNMQKESRIRNLEKRKKYARRYNMEYQERPEVIARIKKRMDLKMFGGNREVALKRDGYKCRICGISQQESLRKLGRDLCVVHINGTSNHSLDNLVTRCVYCHNSTMIKIMRQKLKETRL